MTQLFYHPSCMENDRNRAKSWKKNIEYLPKDSFNESYSS